MSNAVYPLGMKTYNNYLRTGGYKTWKGTGYFSNPVGITWGNLRPFTNNDVYNNVIYKHGSTRPLKQYRKGISIVSGVSSPEIQYQENRECKTSRGNGLVSQIMDYPGCYNAFENKVGEESNVPYLEEKCQKFHGAGMVMDLYPNVNYQVKPPVIMQDGNQPIATKEFCCNQQRNALRMVRSSTNLKQNYSTTTMQYLQNRCLSFQQRQFNFATPNDINGKPGSPLDTYNTYVAQCLPNALIYRSLELQLIDDLIFSVSEIDPSVDTSSLPKESFIGFVNALLALSLSELTRSKILIVVNRMLTQETVQNILGSHSCGRVIYKPNNAQFAVQGAVSAATQILKKDVVTLDTFAARRRKVDPAYTPVLCQANCGSNRPHLTACPTLAMPNRKYAPNLNITSHNRTRNGAGDLIY